MNHQRENSDLVVVLGMMNQRNICPHPDCRKEIMIGAEVVESPNFAGYYYHLECFLKMCFEPPDLENVEFFEAG